MFVAVLAVPLGIFMLADRDARKHFTTPGPYIALAAAIAAMAPHLVWLVQNDFLPFGYAEHRAVLPRGNSGRERPLNASGLIARKSSLSGGAARRVRVLKAQPSFVASCGPIRSRRW